MLHAILRRFILILAFNYLYFCLIQISSMILIWKRISIEVNAGIYSCNCSKMMLVFCKSEYQNTVHFVFYWAAIISTIKTYTHEVQSPKGNNSKLGQKIDFQDKLTTSQSHHAEIFINQTLSNLKVLEIFEKNFCVTPMICISDGDHAFQRKKNWSIILCKII